MWKCSNNTVALRKSYSSRANCNIISTLNIQIHVYGGLLEGRLAFATPTLAFSAYCSFPIPELEYAWEKVDCTDLLLSHWYTIILLFINQFLHDYATLRYIIKCLRMWIFLHTVFIRIVAVATIDFSLAWVRLIIEGCSYSRVAFIKFGPILDSVIHKAKLNHNNVGWMLNI